MDTEQQSDLAAYRVCTNFQESCLLESYWEENTLSKDDQCLHSGHNEVLLTPEGSTEIDCPIGIDSDTVYFEKN